MWWINQYLYAADSSFIPPFVYAIFGSSKHIAVGTVAASSLLIAETIGAKVSPKDDPTLYLHLVFTATFFTGIFQTALGFLRSVFYAYTTISDLIIFFLILYFCSGWEF